MRNIKRCWQKRYAPVCKTGPWDGRIPTPLHYFKGHMITQRTGKVTIKYIESLGGSTLLGLSFRTPCLQPLLQNAITAELGGRKWSSSDAIKRLGPPNVTMRGYESSPGCWLFDHTSGITFLIFSDCHRKHPWRGTSYEVDFPEDTPLTDKQLCDAVIELYATLGLDIVPRSDFCVRY